MQIIFKLVKQIGLFLSPNSITVIELGDKIWTHKIAFIGRNKKCKINLVEIYVEITKPRRLDIGGRI